MLKLHWVFGQSYLPRNNTIDDLAKEMHCFSHHRLFVASGFLPLVLTHVFFWTGGVLSHQIIWYIGTLRLHLKTCVFSLCLLRFLLSSLLRTNPYFKCFSHQNLEFFCEAPWSTQSEMRCVSTQNTSHLTLFCNRLFGDTLYLCKLRSRLWIVGSHVRFHGLLPYPHSKEKAR